MGRFRRLAEGLLVPFVLLLAAPALPAQPGAGRDERESPEVDRVSFRGAKALSTKELEEGIATEESRCRSMLLKPFCAFTHARPFYERNYLDHDELRQDVLRIRVLYWKHGFRSTTVDTTVARQRNGKVRVTFTIAEGPPTVVRVLRVLRPPELLPDRRLTRFLGLRAGQPFDLFALDSTIVRLQTELWNLGYADAEISQEVEPLDSLGVGVRITIDPNARTIVGPITISGNEEISERTIRNSLVFREGQVFRFGDLLQSQRNLYESNLFKHAVIAVAPQEKDSVKSVTIEVREAPLQEIRYGAGFNTVEFVQLDARYTRYNWFGGARRLDLQGVLGNLLARQLNDRLIFRDVSTSAAADAGPFFQPNWQLSADVRQPWFRSAKNSLGLSLFGHRRSFPGVYIDRGFGTSATFTRDFARSATASLNYRFEVTRVEAGDVYFCVNYGVCTPTTIDALRDNQRLSPFALVSNINRADNPLNPARGWNARGEIEHASAFTVSDFRYNRALVEGAYYHRMGRRFVLAAHTRVGWVRALASSDAALGTDVGTFGAIHPRKRFYAGGSQSVRGYGENQLGPRILTIAPEDLRGPEGTRCPETADIASCDPNADGLSDRNFTPRPLGGRSVLEGNLELRFPVWRALSGAVFLDGAIVGEGAVTSAVGGTGAITPGFGVRYATPVGPIRVDIGINPYSSEELTVVTERTNEQGERVIVPLETRRTYAPAKGGFLNRLVLHLSIGQPF